jgi:hypothetical protein
MRYRLLAALLIALVQSGSALPPRVAIVRATAHAWDDESVTMQVQVEPNPENRALVMAASDEGMVVRQSVEQLDGDTARRTRWVTWQSLPAGELMLSATVITADRSVAGTSRRPITVLSRR